MSPDQSPDPTTADVVVVGGVRRAARRGCSPAGPASQSTGEWADRDRWRERFDEEVAPRRVLGAVDDEAIRQYAGGRLPPDDE